MKKILVIDAHPDMSSFCCALAQAYGEAARNSGFDMKILSLRELKFDLNLKKGYQEVQDLEPDLVEAQKLIRWCNHLVIVYPMWWGSMPALLKGFLDRCWLPGFAFKYHSQDPFWDRLLKGRSAHIVVTSDAPCLYNFFAYGNAPYRIMKKTVLGFCGFKPVRVTPLGRIKHLSASERNQVLNKLKKMGSKGL